MFENMQIDRVLLSLPANPWARVSLVELYTVNVSYPRQQALT